VAQCFHRGVFFSAVARRGLLHKLRIDGYFGGHVASFFASIGPMETEKRNKMCQLLMKSWCGAQPGSASNLRGH